VRRIKLVVAYEGTDFFGWQVQPGLPTIQGHLEEAFGRIEKADTHVAGSGRTDSGVHAAGQIAAVSIRNPIPLANLKKALNNTIPRTIRVLSVEEVHPQFHPRFDALSKTYEYRIWRGEVCPPFRLRYVHHHPYPISEQLFTDAASLFVGEHDFSAFAAKDDRDLSVKSNVRRIFTSDVQKEGDELVYRVTGSGFLKYMVRSIVGTLIEASKANITGHDIETLFKNPATKAGPRAPACGLTLLNVNY
jgi:tRNA pseudouridine38-40 synthase